MVFSIFWKDRNAYIANALAMTTGLRLGEILALSKNDIGVISVSNKIIPILLIKHSWDITGADGLKLTKNREERKTPLLPDIKKLLLELFLPQSIL
jgi:integrase